MLQSKELIGKLDRRITFQQIVEEVNAISNESEETGWQDIGTTPTVWANVEEQSGGEEMQADKIVATTVTRFTIRYRSDITERNRIMFNGVPYGITSILESGRKRFLKITGIAGQPEYVEA